MCPDRRHADHADQQQHVLLQHASVRHPRTGPDALVDRPSDEVGDGEGGARTAQDHEQSQQQPPSIGPRQVADELAAALAQAAGNIMRDLVDVFGGHAAPGVALLLGGPAARDHGH